MKLRLKGNSLRLRVTRSELTSLQAGKRIQESVLFPADPPASLGYVLGIGSHNQPVHVVLASQQIVVSLSQDQLVSWSGEHQVGIYASLPVAEGTVLEVAIEKDFACLDLSDEDNTDTFANPMAGKAC
ncbi:DUF7009 family protein [Edaphobacter modestus]|uniref:Uncharacterized protein n=1 Tax=Edaphobacter modestus TaxID=388466 RepID=A0A4Q7YMY7_9BACT|nr:hypothetical protein [Edaphobacter modestus]RZU39102.1 hypothetical protein BDD14_0431 [Edaphobacter modestus]